ncbi:DUF3631 domain-containing protein [Nocardia amamiensis]|uniref:DUF3631 domain-containing protein n=1 Tax=Nocardia amamiensis TaxID=404578 RepID=UPI0033C40678
MEPDPLLEAGLAGVLEEVREHFAAYVYTADPDDSVTLALWTAHTYACEETYTSPRLKFDSPMPGSGKTTGLEHIQHVARDPLLMSTVSSSALVPRILDQEIRTLLIDECDRSLSPKKPGIEDVLAIINSGYKRSSTRPVLVPDKENGGWSVEEMSTYSPVAMAGNAPDLPEDTVSRCIEILCVPANNGEVLETDWELIEDETTELGRRLGVAVEQALGVISGARPSLPAKLTGRRKEVWRPLARIASAAGGDWPSRLEKIIVKDMERNEMMREDGAIKARPHVVLLADLQKAFGEQEFVPTAELLERLARGNPEMWAADAFKSRTAITAQRMGRMLSTNYRIHSWRPTSPKNAARGYRRSDFDRAWQYMGLTKKENNS